LLTHHEEQLFRASEILDMAVQIERQGTDFYEKCAEVSQDNRIRDVLELLAEQERNHAQVFSDMKEGLDDYVLPESYPGETRSYLDSFVRDKVFAGPEQAVERSRKISDPFAVVDLALEVEKSSILFYSGMRQVVRPSEHDAIERVIGEEHNHIRRLLALRRTLE
jgi:rubrerythrin